MGFTTQTVTAKVLAAKQAVITNFAAALANTEYSHALQDNLKSLTIKARGASKLQIAFVLGDSSTNYITIPKGAVFHERGLDFSGVTLYLQASNAGETIEILEMV